MSISNDPDAKDEHDGASSQPSIAQEDYPDARDDCQRLAVITRTRTTKNQKKLKE